LNFIFRQRNRYQRFIYGAFLELFPVCIEKLILAAIHKKMGVVTMKPDRRAMSVRTADSSGKILQSFLLLVTGLFLFACQQMPTTVSDVDSTGIYNLISVDGLEVPANVSHGDVPLRVSSGTFTIKANGTCISRIVFGMPSGDKMTREVKATYTRKGSKLRMQWEGAGTTEGTVEGDSFTMDNEGMIFIYKKK